MWAELSEARLIPSLARTRHKHTNKLPRDGSALSSRGWRPPPPASPRTRSLPGERGLGRTGAPGEHPHPPVPHADTAPPARAGDIPGRSRGRVSRRGMSSAALQPVGTGGPERSRGGPEAAAAPEYGKRETGMLRCLSSLSIFK